MAAIDDVESEEEEGEEEDEMRDSDEEFENVSI